MKTIDEYTAALQKSIDHETRYLLDDLVHDLKSQEASTINNSSLRDQIAFIVEQGAAESLDEILANLSGAANSEPGPDRCTNSTGHEFVCTGTAYGGDDKQFHGEGRCYCIHCGADGDA